ncbi:glycosyltransferase family 2 protein [Ruegeria atlantica]|nr:glycosyltransferase family A protein [Ruegeria atlantica]
MDINVFTAVYNHEATIADTIDSVLMQQTQHSFHMFCFDDASTDGSGRILEEYRARHPDKITVFTSTQNQGSGKKSFLHHMPPHRSRFWCLLAGDDYWTSPDKLERQVELLDISPNAVGCCAHTVMRNEVTGNETIIAPQLDRWNLMDMLVGTHALYVHPSSILWRNIHLKSGFFLPPGYVNSQFSGDTLLLHMMLFGGGELVNLPEVTSCYRVTGRGVWSGLSQEEKSAQNENVEQHINSILPLRHRLSRRLRKSAKYRRYADRWPLPQPIGEPMQNSSATL